MRGTVVSSDRMKPVRMGRGGMTMRIDLLETDVPAAVDAVLKKCGKTPYDLSEIAGVASGTIYNWKLGAFDPRLPQFMWFLDAAGARLIIEMDEGGEENDQD